jgi:hypothetical protein
MKYCCSLLLIVLVGCGVSGTTTAPTTTATETAKFALIRSRVVFVGDQVTVNMFTPAFQQQHPNWTNAGVAGETTAQALAAFQAQCIAPHPQVCHVMIGLNDFLAALNAYAPEPDEQMEADILQMAQEASAAGIELVLATEFPSWYGWEPPAPGDSVGGWPPMDLMAGDLNFWMDPPAGYTLTPGEGLPASVVIADYWAPLTGNCDFSGDDCDYLSGLSTDDIVPNAAGYFAMEPVMIDAIDKASEAQLASSK